TELRIDRPNRDIHHVLVHDSGNYFEVDSICTDAGSVAQSRTIRWPWPSDQRWSYNTGPHDNKGLDFQPPNVSGCGTDGVGNGRNFWVYPVASGTIVSAKKPGPTDSS